MPTAYSSAVLALLTYWRGLYACLIGGASYAELQVTLPNLERASLLHIYWLCLHVRLFHEKHYRSGTFGNDCAKNLRNVALPGTGVPLSLVCVSRAFAASFLWLGVPFAALAAGCVRRLHERRKKTITTTTLSEAFASALLPRVCTVPGRSPWDGFTWFAFWRLNCVLASYHALRTGEGGYALEDKLAFLEACERESVPASPWLRDAPRIVVKHRNEEGGLGLHTFTNAACGGDWIVQHWLRNGPTIARLLPEVAPLSTLRLVSASRACCRRTGSATARASEGSEADVSVLSGCFRAGRAGANTDHSCVMFDLDLASGELRNATSNSHWYQLGAGKARRCAWASPGHTLDSHPDTGVRVAGETIEGMSECVALVRRAHAKLLPHVPLVGWDVALTEEAGICLLEANLSCNFFRASFDQDAYFTFVEQVLRQIEEPRSASS